jgi:hypothetical protein
VQYIIVWHSMEVLVMLSLSQSVGRDEQLCMLLQAEERLGAMFGPTVVPSLVGPNWKERLETMAYMQEKVCALAQTNDEFAIASTELSCIL